MSIVSIRKTQRLLIVPVLAFALALSPVGGVQFASAAAGTQTWTGAAGDGKFSTAGNWAEDEVPEAGDALVFNTVPIPASGGFRQVLDNDVDVAYAGLTTQSPAGGNSNYYAYTLKNVLKLQANPTWSVHNDLQLASPTGIQVAGDMLVTGQISGPITATGIVTVRGSGTTLFDIPSAAGLIIENGASLRCFSIDSNPTISYPITLGSATGSEKASIAPGLCTGGVGNTPSAKKLTINNVTLASDAEIGVWHPHAVEIKNLNKNGHTLTRAQFSTGQLITPDGVQENTKKTTQLTGNKPSENVSVTLKETAILNGTRADLSVGTGGTLKGSGNVSNLWVSGTVAPGNSPGKITVADQLSLYKGATYQAEIFDKDSYDQLIVKNGPVNVTDATLSVKFLAGGKVNKGETFTIVDNQSNNAVQGTFLSYAEGTKIAIGDAVFAISYVGGTGNDVVLTALTTAKAPGTPNTGFQLALKNPVIIALIGIVAAGAVLLVARRLSAQK